MCAIWHRNAMTIGERIRLARKKAGLSQERLGETLGVTKQMVSHIEVGRHAPTVDHVITICQRCDVTADFLLLGLDRPAPIDARIAEAARRIAAMPSQQQELLFQMFSASADPEKVENFANKPRR
jgi:transcriptional regulator with XRE-family HTH domain